jgi:sec-independent protein translocase protein TatA
MFGLGAQELLLILVIVLVLFGAKRIPEIARGLGRSMSEFKKGIRDVDHEMRDALDTSDKPARPQGPQNKSTSS